MKILQSYSRFVKIIQKRSFYSSKMSLHQNFKVFITQPIPKEAVQYLKSKNIDFTINEITPLSREKLLDSVRNVDALFCTLNEKIDKKLLDTAGPNLKVLRKFLKQNP